MLEYTTPGSHIHQLININPSFICVFHVCHNRSCRATFKLHLALGASQFPGTVNNESALCVSV